MEDFQPENPVYKLSPILSIQGVLTKDCVAYSVLIEFSH